MHCLEYLDRSHAHYKMVEHVVPFTSQQAVAERNYVPGIETAVAEPMRVDDDVFLFVYPRDYAIDIGALRRQFGAEDIKQVTVNELPDRGPEKAEQYVPFGSLYGLLTFVDRRIGLKEYIVFYDPETEQDVRMEIAEYRRLAHPRILDFAYCTR